MAERWAPGAAVPTGTSPDEDTVGWRIWRLLRERGVDAVFGDRGAGLPVAADVPPALAPMLAAAYGRVHRREAAAWSAGVLRFGGAAGAEDGRTVTAGNVAELPDAVGFALREAGGSGHASLELDLDLAAPAGPWRPGPPREDPVPDPAPWLERLAAASDPVVLAGPGVVSAGAVPGLHAFATAGRVGVLNTWGAKGVFPWQSPHHWATVGLQRDDFRLAGLADTDLIVATGLDEDEAPAARWRLADHITLDPRTLGAVAAGWRRGGEPAPMPGLRRSLAAVTQRGWAREHGPLPPSRVTLNYGDVVAAHGGLVAADQGTAGFWVARTVATPKLGTVVVPAAVRDEGFAVACALAARLVTPGRPVLAVTDRLPGDRGSALLELAERLGAPVPVEVWNDRGDMPDAGEHARRLAGALYGPRSTVLTLATDPGQMEEMTGVAGPVVAW